MLSFQRSFPTRKNNLRKRVKIALQFYDIELLFIRKLI
nr:MAG TPA_asm: hypothetical protein [Bacteriophage sp.]